MTKLDKAKLSEGIRLAAVHLQQLEVLIKQLQEIIERTTDWR